MVAAAITQQKLRTQGMVYYDGSQEKKRNEGYSLS